MQCPSCRSANEDDAQVCFTCGASLSSVAPITQGQVIADRYVIEARLGRGGMGTVYRAYDRALEEDVALKVMGTDAGVDAELERRFRSEIRLARKITDRNVCRIYDYGESAGRRFISMELIDGIDLKRLLKELGAFPSRAAYDIAIQVARGLEAIHEAGIVHRDLKTLNVMRDRCGLVKVMDFGIARRVEPGADSSTTGTGRVVGTPDYMSPEQARGEKVDIRSDIYALGVVIFEIFTGELPFRADTPMAVLLKHINEPPPLDGPAGRLLPEELRPVLRRALAKQRTERYSSVAEMIADLEDARAMDPGGAGGARPPVILGAAIPDTESLLAPTPIPGQVGTAPATAASVTLPARAAATQARRTRAAIAAVALVGAAVLYQRWSGTASETTDRKPGTAPSAVPAPSPVAAATGSVAVSINALPWARLRLSAVDGRAAVPGLAEDERVTPLHVLLAEGEYMVELENGGLTPALRERLQVRRGQVNAFEFVMPGYDPGAVPVQP